MAKNVLITGGAGFIGSAMARSYAREGAKVTIVDNLSRAGSTFNLKKLQTEERQISFIKADISRDISLIKRAIKGSDLIFHFAGQVAVNQSIATPFKDFMTNAVGTVNLLEIIRNHNPEALFLFASSMRVYGQMKSELVKKNGNSYFMTRFPRGIPEEYPLDLHTPYSCSKGAADQYVRDYARTFNLRTIVFRQSCIYGSGQFAIENHGWVNWFIASALAGRKIRIFGDGHQVRDVLYIDDLIEAYRAAVKQESKAVGEIFNVGGGGKCSLSLRTLLDQLKKDFGIKTSSTYSAWRKGDTKAYVSDIKKAERILRWSPKTSILDGIEQTIRWIESINNK
jgi:CDP-paratose 2-epimerase